ncbi:MAG: hypothetical protein BMS9Abin02_0359 [Anaerolineae bacterium]|nr:MAG: hypothetical protein BMS9Abin02_0359 [Anaerolineae bacterium]
MTDQAVAKDNFVDTAALISTLAQLDIHYLRSPSYTEPLPLDPDRVIAELSQHPDPRLREALIPLFLRHPELSKHVPHLVGKMSPAAGERLQHMYTAAVYLQRLWLGKLEMYLGPLPSLPDYYGQSLWELPTPEDHYGEAGLRALADHFQTKTGDNWLSTYQTTMLHFLHYLRLDANG